MQLVAALSPDFADGAGGVDDDVRVPDPAQRVDRVRVGGRGEQDDVPGSQGSQVADQRGNRRRGEDEDQPPWAGEGDCGVVDAVGQLGVGQPLGPVDQGGPGAVVAQPRHEHGGRPRRSCGRHRVVASSSTADPSAMAVPASTSFGRSTFVIAK